MYERFWGLREKPFLNTPNPRFVFYSQSHEEALVRMLYAVTECKGFMLLLGEEGVGKTFTAQVFLKELRNKGFPVAFLRYPGRTSEELLIQTLYEFGIPHRNASRIEKLQVLAEAAVSVGQKGQHLILLVDDAQLITDPQTFEEFRAFLNLSSEDRFLITVFLCGSPDLWGRLVEVPGLRQRVGVSYRILPLPREETAEYIAHRLRVAGRENPTFEDDAVDVIHGATRGVPREINNLCDLCLLIGSGEDVDAIKPHLVEKALDELAGAKIMSPGEA